MGDVESVEFFTVGAPEYSLRSESYRVDRRPWNKFVIEFVMAMGTLQLMWPISKPS
jgi:hypothetical protein